MKKIYEEANDKTEKIVGVIYKEALKQMPVFSEIQKPLHKSIRYIADLSKEEIEAIDNGLLQLSKENGNTYAQFKLNGKYSTKIPIKKEMFGEEIKPVQIANAMQIQALQEQIEDISEQIFLIDDVVKEISVGQQNDRIGLYYSGLALFVEAEAVSDPTLKSSMISQALRELSEAIFQLKLTLESDIKYIKNKEFKNFKGKRSELITEHINKIDQSFAFIHRAFLLKAAVYCNIEEFMPMVKVLDEYSSFINVDIKENAVMLSQYDRNDDGTSEGLWQGRTNLQLDTDEIIKQLKNSSQNLYLSIE